MFWNEEKMIAVALEGGNCLERAESSNRCVSAIAYVALEAR